MSEIRGRELVQEIDYYEVLGVSSTSDQVVIRAAYKAMMLKYHPDTNKEPNADKRAKEIIQAFEILSNTEKRSAYDAAREQQRNQSKPPPPPPGTNSSEGFKADQAMFRRLGIAIVKVVIAIPVLIILVGTTAALIDAHNKFSEVREKSDWLAGFYIGQPREDVIYRFNAPHFVATTMGRDSDFEFVASLPEGKTIDAYPVWRWNNFSDADIVTVEFNAETNSIKSIKCDGQSRDYFQNQRQLKNDGSCVDYFSSQYDNYGMADEEEYKNVAVEGEPEIENQKVYHFKDWGFSLTV